MNTLRYLSSSSLATPRSRLANLRERLASESEDVSVSVDAHTLTSSVMSFDSSSPSSSESFAFHLKTYGCQMNVSDSEVVRSIMLSSPHPKFHEVSTEAEADVSLTNTCAIRNNAEKKVWNRAYQLRAASKKARKKQVRRW